MVMATYDTDVQLTVGLEPEDVISTAEQINKELGDIFKRSDGLDLSKKFKSTLEAAEQVKTESQEILEALRELANTRLPSTEYRTLGEALEHAEQATADSIRKTDKLIDKQQELAHQKVPTQEYTNLQTEIADSESALERLRWSMQRLIDQTKTGKPRSKAFQSMQAEAKKLEAEIDVAKARLQELENNGKKFESLQVELTNSENALTRVQTSMQALIDKTKTGKPRSKAFKDLQAEAEALKTKIEETKAELQKLEESGKNFELGRNTPEFIDLENQIERERELRKIYEQERVRASANMARLEKAGADTTSGTTTYRYQELIDELNEINNRGIQAREALLGLGEVEPPATLGERMRSFASAVGSAGLNLQKFILGSPLNLIQRSLTTIANSAQRAGKALLNMASRTVTNGLKNLGKSIAGVSRHSSRNNNVLEKGFKSFIKYAFGVRSFFFLFRKIRSAIIDGFGDLAQVHEPFNAAMSSIMTSLGYLRNSFASAFAPIIETVAPALTAFINLVASAVSQIGMLIAALTGKEFVMALPVQKDYAASVGNTAKNAGKASKATADQNKKAKELQRTLAGFDDVEILHEDDDTDSDSSPSGGGGGGGGGGGIGFTTSTISGAVKDFAAKLLDAWNKADFTEIGKIVGEKLKEALERIPWTKIKKTLRKIAKVIATFLNGFLEVPGLFYTIGKTLAEGLNSAFEFLDSFIQNFHWHSLGKAIRDGILGITKNIDWTLIFRTFSNLGKGIATFINEGFTNPEVWTEIFTTIANAFNSILLGLISFVGTVKWEDLASSIGTGLSNGIRTFRWDSLGTLLIDAVNNIINIAFNFVSTFDYKAFGSSIGSGVSRAITEIDWIAGSASVAGAISGLFEALNGFIENVDWKELGSKVVTTIATFLNTFDWSAFGEFISNCFIGLWSFFSGIIETIDWEEIPGKILSIISAFLTGFDWSGTVQALGEILAAEFKALVDAGSSLLTAVFLVAKEIIEGGKDGILDALTGIGSWIVDNIFNPFIEGVKAAFGIASPAKEMKPIGENIIEGMLQGILNPLSTITSWIDKNIFKPISGGVESAFGLNSGKSSFNIIGTDLITELQSGISNITGRMGSWISNNLTNKINSFVTSDWGINGSSASSFNKFGTALIGGLQSGLTTAAHASQAWLRTSVTTTISDYFSSLMGIGKNSGTFTRFGISMMGDLRTGISNNSYTIINALTSLHSDMVNAFSGYSWSSIGDNIAVGLYNGIVSNWNWLVNTVHNLAVSMYNAAVDALDIHSPSKKFAWIGDMVTAGLSDGIASTGDRVLNAMSDITDGLIEDAENANPALALDGSLSNLDSNVDSVLSDFSDKVVSEFSMLISTLERLSSSLQLAVPGIVLGQVAPYSIGSTSNSSANTISKLLEVIQTLTANQITREDLQEVIDAIDNKDLDVILGDEQVARSANRGNKKLSRRYNPVVL